MQYRVRIDMTFRHLPPHPRQMIPLVSHLIELVVRQGFPVPFAHDVQIHARNSDAAPWTDPQTGVIAE